MIKFSKWIYELGYNSALRDVLSLVDGIPNEKPRPSEMNAHREEIAKKRFRIAQAVYDERRMFKRYMHQSFDPNYEADVNDLVDRRFGDDDDCQ